MLDTPRPRANPRHNTDSDGGTLRDVDCCGQSPNFQVVVAGAGGVADESQQQRHKSWGKGALGDGPETAQPTPTSRARSAGWTGSTSSVATRPPPARLPAAPPSMRPLSWRPLAGRATRRRRAVDDVALVDVIEPVDGSGGWCRSVALASSTPTRASSRASPRSPSAALNSHTELRATCKFDPGAVSSRDPDGDPPPLHWAAARGCHRSVDVLLEFGASVNALDAHGDTHAAWYKCGEFAIRPDLQESERPDPKDLSSAMSDAMSLHCALNQYKPLKQLLRSDTSTPTEPTRPRRRPLPLPLGGVRGNLQCVQLLIE